MGAGCVWMWFPRNAGGDGSGTLGVCAAGFYWLIGAGLPECSSTDLKFSGPLQLWARRKSHRSNSIGQVQYFDSNDRKNDLFFAVQGQRANTGVYEAVEAEITRRSGQNLCTTKIKTLIGVCPSMSPSSFRNMMEEHLRICEFAACLGFKSSLQKNYSINHVCLCFKKNVAPLWANIEIRYHLKNPTGVVDKRYPCLPSQRNIGHNPCTG